MKTQRVERPWPMPDPSRPGWLVEQSADGSSLVGWPAESKPVILANHVDGPLCTFRNGEMHWLTLWERVLFAFGRVDSLSIERKYRPHLSVDL